VFRSDRLDVLVEGIRLLNPVQFLSGAGLTSVIVSGPHNDYVRWTQRVGLFAMFLGFAPFVIAFWRSFRKMREPHEGTPTWAFLNAGVAFTLFHSLFGYPREDAFQAPYAFLGLALWLGVIGTAEGDSASSAEPRTPLGERARPDTELDDPMGDG
jgi:O-antigen ligase